MKQNLTFLKKQIKIEQHEEKENVNASSIL